MVRPTLVLLYGFFGFSRRGPIEYFRGVEQALCQAHIVPLIPEVPPAGTMVSARRQLPADCFAVTRPPLLWSRVAVGAGPGIDHLS